MVTTLHFKIGGIVYIYMTFAESCMYISMVIKIFTIPLIGGMVLRRVTRVTALAPTIKIENIPRLQLSCKITSDGFQSSST